MRHVAIVRLKSGRKVRLHSEDLGADYEIVRRLLSQASGHGELHGTTRRGRLVLIRAASVESVRFTKRPPPPQR